MIRAKEFTKQGRRVAINGSELTAHMAVVLADEMKGMGIEVGKAEEIAVNTVDSVSSMFGGQNIYFPKNQRSHVQARDIEIYERHARNELSIPEIAHEYDISLQWAYKIISAVRLKRRQQREQEIADQKAAAHELWKREN